MHTLALVLAAVFVLIWLSAVTTWVYGVVHTMRARKFFHPPPPTTGRSTAFARFDVTNYDASAHFLVARARKAMVVFMGLIALGMVVMAAALAIMGSHGAS